MREMGRFAPAGEQSRHRPGRDDLEHHECDSEAARFGDEAQNALAGAQGALDAAFARKVKSAGLKLYVWTVNDVALARRMVEIGVDGITTDRPGWLREQLAK